MPDATLDGTVLQKKKKKKGSYEDFFDSSEHENSYNC